MGRFRPRLKHPSFHEPSQTQLLVALCAARWRWLAAVLLLALAGTTTAQEALRYSLAGQDAAEARKRALENENYNLKMGPVKFRFSGALGIEATDNVRYTGGSPQADLIFRPQLNTFAQWRLTEKNSLSLGLGIGYEKFINTADYDRFFITPDTDLSFDIYAGDFLINLHDRFSYSSDVTANPTITGTGSQAHFGNTLGIRTVWDLNKAFLSASYDHQNYISAESQFDNLTHSAELFTAAFGFQLRPTVQIGLQVGGGLLDYNAPLSQDNQHISIGPFVSAQLSEYTSFRLSAGYVTYFLNAFGVTNAASTLDAYYVDGSLNQRVGQLLTHSLSIGRSLQPGLGSQFGAQVLDLWRIQYSAAWNVLRKTGVGTTFSFEHGTQGGVTGETFDRWGGGISFSRALTKKASGSIGYQFYLRNSNIPTQDYTQNRLVLNVVYAF